MVFVSSSVVSRCHLGHTRVRYHLPCVTPIYSAHLLFVGLICRSLQTDIRRHSPFDQNPGQNRACDEVHRSIKHRLRGPSAYSSQGDTAVQSSKPYSTLVLVSRLRNGNCKFVCGARQLTQAELACSWS